MIRYFIFTTILNAYFSSVSFSVVVSVCMCVGVLWWSRARVNMFSTGPVVWISGRGGERGWGDRVCLWAYWKCVRQLRNAENRVGM